MTYARSMSMPPFQNPLWEQIQKVRANGKDGIQMPVKANGTDGIVIGDPPLFVPPTVEKAERPGLLRRLLARLRG